MRIGRLRFNSFHFSLPRLLRQIQTDRWTISIIPTSLFGFRVRFWRKTNLLFFTKMFGWTPKMKTSALATSCLGRQEPNWNDDPSDRETKIEGGMEDGKNGMAGCRAIPFQSCFLWSESNRRAGGPGWAPGRRRPGARRGFEGGPSPSPAHPEYWESTGGIRRSEESP